MEKICCMCKKSLPVENFKSNKKRKDGLQSQCISCHKEYRRQHYLSNQQKYIDKAVGRRSLFFRWWKEYKKQFFCAECGENHPACIDFHHHSDDKEACVSELVCSCSKTRLLIEIDKCTPLCSNCHRKKHWRE